MALPRSQTTEALPLTGVIKFVIMTLQAWARRRQWGELRIVVQFGQIYIVTEHRSYRGGVPDAPEDRPEDKAIEQAAIDMLITDLEQATAAGRPA